MSSIKLNKSNNAKELGGQTESKEEAKNLLEGNSRDVPTSQVVKKNEEIKKCIKETDKKDEVNLKEVNKKEGLHKMKEIGENFFNSTSFSSFSTLCETKEVDQKEEQLNISNEKEWRDPSLPKVVQTAQTNTNQAPKLPKRRHKKYLRVQSVPETVVNEAVAALAVSSLKDGEPGHKGDLVASAPWVMKPGNSESYHPFWPSYKTKAGMYKKRWQREPSHSVDSVPTSPSLSAPSAKRPRYSQPDHSFPSSSNPKPKAESCKIAIMPEDYPTTVLTSGQAEDIRSQLTSKLDELDVPEESLLPEFSGFGLKSGACILTCETQASKTWLVNCVESLSTNSWFKLRVGTLQEVYTNVKVGIYFPGNRVADDVIIKRLITQNPKVTDINKWKFIGGRVDGRGYFGVLRIPATSFEYLEKGQNLQVNYGMGKVKVRYLETKGGSYSAKKKGKSKDRRRPDVRAKWESHNTKWVGGTEPGSGIELEKGDCSSPTSDTPMRGAPWKSDNYCGPASGRPGGSGSPMESDSFCEPAGTMPESRFTRNSDNYSQSTSTRTGSYGTGNYGGPARSRFESDSYDGNLFNRIEKEESFNYRGSGNIRTEREPLWRSDNFEEPTNAKTDKGPPRKSLNYSGPENTQPGSEPATESGNYGDSVINKNERGEPFNYGGPTSNRTERGWKSGSYSESTVRPPDRGAQWKSESYGGPTSSIFERGATQNSDSRGGPARSRPGSGAILETSNYSEPERGTLWKSNNYGGPANTRQGSGPALESDNYGESDINRNERGATWKSESHTEPTGSRIDIGASWKSDNYGGPARGADNYTESGSTRTERGAAWEAYGGPENARTERGSLWNKDNYSGPASTKPRSGPVLESDNYGEPAINRNERRGTWKSNSYDEPPMVRRTERGTTWKPDNHGGPVNIRTGSGTRMKSNNYSDSVNSRTERGVVGESQKYGVPEGARTEGGGLWNKDNYGGSASTKPRSGSAFESDHYGEPAINRNERGATWKSDSYDELQMARRTDRGTSWNPDNHGRPVSIRPGIGAPMESDNYSVNSRIERGAARETSTYGGPGNARTERGALWNKDNYGGPNKSGPAFESENYRESAATQNERDGTWKSGSYGEQKKDRGASSAPHPSFSWKPDNYGGPVSTIPGGGVPMESENYTESGSSRTERRAARAAYGVPENPRTERGSLWNKDNCGGPTSTKPRSGPVLESDNYDELAINRNQREAAWNSGSYREPTSARTDIGAPWKSDGGQANIPPVTLAEWKSDSYGRSTSTRMDRGAVLETDNYSGGTRINPGSGPSREPNNYSGPGSTRNERGAAFGASNYSGPARTSPEIRDTWKSDNYNVSASNRIAQGAALDRSGYGVSASTMGGSWKSDNFSELSNNRPEREAALEAGNYNAPSRSHGSGAERESLKYKRPNEWESGENDNLIRKRPIESGGGWESASLARSAWSRRDPTSQTRMGPETSVCQSASQKEPAWTKRERPGRLGPGFQNKPPWERH